MNRLLLILLYISYLIPCKGQNQANIWYFGANAGIDFNGLTPTALVNSSMVSAEGTAVASGPDGSVLFYTNGEQVWNRTHQLMTNGTGLLGSSEATESSVIIQKPGSKSKYYIFTVDDLGSSNGFKYSEVDMSASGGLGSVISKNNHLEWAVTEKLAAIRHRNGKDYWVLVHQRNTSRFIAYQVTETGLQSPVNSDVGSSHTASTGYLKFAPNGEKVACAVGGGVNFVEIFDFNDSSGVVSSPMKVEYTAIPYGVEFSPNSKRLYVTAANRIYQYTLPAVNNSTLLGLSESTLSTDGLAWAMQTGPDGKIYVCKQGSKLGIINDPNNELSLANFQDNIFSLNGRLAIQGLPNFIQNLFNDEFIIATNGCANQPIRFSVRLNGLDSIRWNFGDNKPGSRVTSFSPVYKYANSGTFTVSATVYNSGVSETYTKSVTIYALPQFSLGNDTTLCKGSTINYNISLPGATYLWNTGNRTGKQLIGARGVYFLEVSQNGCVLRDSITVNYSNLRASFDVNNPAQCISGNQFELTSTSTGAVSQTWFIDGHAVATGAKFVQSFAFTGTYKAGLVAASAEGCVDSVSKDISVNANPKADFAIKVENNCGASNKILITDKTIYSGDYNIEFESDGYKIKSSPYTFHYSKPGTYSITLSVKTVDGCQDKITKTVTVYPLPEATFTIDRQNVCSDNNKFVLSKRSALGAQETIAWFADGKQLAAGGERQTCSFTSPGKHLLKAEVTNIVGCKATYEEEVEVFKSPVVDFATSSGELKCLGGEPVKFVNQTKDDNTIASYTWNFGDNSTANVANPVKSYDQQGAYTVVLTVVNSKGCSASVSKQVSTFEKPKISISYQDMGHCADQNSYILTFNNSNPAADISGFTWDLKGARQNGTSNPVWVSYPQAGDYKAGVKVETANGCTDEAEIAIKVHPLPKGQLAVNTENQCINDNRFIVSSHYDQGTASIITYNWNLGNGMTIDGVDNIEAVYTRTGKYTISLDVTDANGCKARFEKQVAVNSSPEFTLENATACTGQPAKLEINGLDKNLYITDWQWNFGDGGTSNLAQPTYTYKTPGTYLASLTVTASGCTYASRATVSVTDLPKASFTDRRISWGFEETEVEFKSGINEPGYTCSWDFGNGKTGNKPVELVKFDKAGSYDIVLTVTSPGGCEGIVTKQVVIYPPFDAYVPTCFTPNGDGKNDVFGMEGVEYIKTYKMEVFNRWGQAVFVTTDLNQKWDGKFNDQAMPPGMFTYVLTITDMDGNPFILTGSVQLLR